MPIEQTEVMHRRLHRRKLTLRSGAPTEFVASKMQQTGENRNIILHCLSPSLPRRCPPCHKPISPPHTPHPHSPFVTFFPRLHRSIPIVLPMLVMIKSRRPIDSGGIASGVVCVFSLGIDIHGFRGGLNGGGWGEGFLLVESAESRCH